MTRPLQHNVLQARFLLGLIVIAFFQWGLKVIVRRELDILTEIWKNYKTIYKTIAKTCITGSVFTFILGWI